MITQTQTPDSIRARAIAEVRIPAALAHLRIVREHLAQIPIIYDVEGRCLYQATDAVTDALRKLEQMAEAHDISPDYPGYRAS